MGSEDKKIKPKIVSKCSKYIIAVCFLYMICSVAPVSGFFLKSCRISYSTAICVQNEFKKVPQDIPPTVTGFNLSKNQISRIHETDFIHLPVLTKLDLFRNNISQIDSFAFAHLISLQWLNLNHNNLVTLEENVFDGLSNLTQLLITYNHIKVVSFTAFQSLLNLKVLDISNNKLHKTTDLHLMLQHLPQLKQLVIKANDFTHFRSWELTNHSMELCVLDLSFNLLKDFRITTDIFPNLTDFTISSPFRNPPMKWDVQSKTFLSRVSSLDVSGLHVSRNDMKVLLETVNSSITSLKMNRMKLNLSILINVSCTIPTMSMLQVQYNKLEFISSDLFKLCVNVTQLDLAKNNIHTIQERAFTSLVNLRTLSLTSNNLLSVPLATGELRNLSKLDLSFNKIRAVGCQDFSNHVELIELNLQHNSISALKDCAFKDLVQLQVLRLQSNQLTSLNGAFKNPLPNLKQLRLNGNKLVSISKGEFTGLKSLLNLSLHDNQIGGLHADSFVGLINLIEMQLKSNRITRQDLDTGAFNVLMNLRRLDLSINHIKYTNSTVLTQPPFSKLSLLEDLAIPAQHYRKTAFLPPNLLLGLTNLVRFSARNIWLVYMDKDTFKDTPKLKTLDINSNDLVSLSPQLFFPIQNLKSLYISRTSLRSLDFLTEANLSKLEFLQAAYNQFPIITEDVIMSLPSLLYVDFRHNSFSCDCDNSWFLNWTKNSAQTQVSGAFNFSCNYPDDFKDTKLLDFDLTSCSLQTGFICFISTTCMIFCFMITSFIYHFMGWQLYCAYYLFLAWLYDKKQENKQAPHQYDAFISYNTHDEPWVIGELLPKLEGEQGWRLCLHHRDFEPGKPIIDNITDAIYGSRKTICVISRQYLESEWCSREVQTASFRLFDEQKDVLILLFLEDIPTYLLSPYHRMRKMLKKKTYLSWTRAAEHPDVFWEKLRQALQTGEDFNQGSFSVNVLQAQ